MSYQALYRVWRPETFRDIVGQDAIVKTLVNQVETGRIAHAYLFTGSRGTGKTTTAKVLARAVNCLDLQPFAEPCGRCAACVQLQNENNLDVVEIDAASNNGVDEIRELRDKIQYPPQAGRYRVYIIDEVHMLSAGAFNALLKTLEEPPAHAVFILATTEPQRLPATILSRCQRFDFHRIRLPVIVDRLKTVLDGSGARYEEAALTDIARAAEGGMRDALSIADMCLGYGSGELTVQLVSEALGSAGRDFLFDFADALIDARPAKALSLIDRLMREGRDPQVFARDAAAHLRALMLAQLAGEEAGDILEITPEDAQRYREQAGRANPDMLLRALDLFIAAEADMRWSQQPRPVVELAAVRACQPEREKDATLEERLALLEKKIARGQLPPPPPRDEPSPKDASQAGPPTQAATASQAGSPSRGAASSRKAPAARPVSPEAQRMWDAVLDRLKAENPSAYGMIRDVTFLGAEGGEILLRLPRARQIYARMLEQPRFLRPIEETVTSVFGEEMRLRVESDTAAKSAPSSAARGNLVRAFEVFGRENVVVTDD